jgi:hypothetical protein
MNEYAVKLELREGMTQKQEDDLLTEEDKYDKLMTDLNSL